MLHHTEELIRVFRPMQPCWWLPVTYPQTYAGIHLLPISYSFHCHYLIVIFILYISWHEFNHQLCRRHLSTTNQLENVGDTQTIKPMAASQPLINNRWSNINGRSSGCAVASLALLSIGGTDIGKIGLHQALPLCQSFLIFATILYTRVTNLYQTLQ